MQRALLKKSSIGVVFILILVFFVAHSMAQSTGTGQVMNDTILLYPGWNLIPVTPSMEGLNLSSMNLHPSNKCEDGETGNSDSQFLAVTFDNRNQKWVTLQNFGQTLPSFIVDINKIDIRYIGGLWINVKNECILGCGLIRCIREVNKQN